MLTLLALPLLTEAHTQQEDRGSWNNPEVPPGFFQQGHKDRGQDAPAINPNDIINWIRVYKNPETVSREKLTRPGTFAGLSVYDFSAFGIDWLVTYLQPSEYFSQHPQELFWVRFDATTGELFEEADNPNSGRVTATEHTSVAVGDLVAIAVNITTWGGVAIPDMAIGPIAPPKGYGYWLDRTRYSTDRGRNERKWRLQANMPLWNGSPAGDGTYDETTLPAHKTHTFVYQFRVRAEHVELNDDGPWLKQNWVTETTEVTEPFDKFGSADLRQFTAFDWLWGEDEDALPAATAVKPFNTYQSDNRFLANWGAERSPTDSSDITFNNWAYVEYISLAVEDSRPGRSTQDVLNINTGRYSHRHVPMFDPAVKGAIFYPKITLPGIRATTEVDVPEGTQTGDFIVTLRFSESVEGVPLFENHDTSVDSVAAFKDKLTTALAKSRWTVKAFAGPAFETAASNPASRPHSSATAYTLTLSPPEGVKATLELQIPENMVMDTTADANGDVAGNLASETFEISVDTRLRELRLAEGKSVEIPDPADGAAYLAGDAIEVRVPFAQDGLTYEGDAPYIVIYLGEETDEHRRHATWQKGSESAGSTIVPFRYIIDALDPIVSSVRVDAAAGVLRPAGTTLMNGAGQVWREGDAKPAMASGEKAPVPAADAGLSLLTATGEQVPEVEASVQVLPAVYLPPEESEPKAGMSSVPRTPIVFNELGNGSGDTNDWLELRNVTGDAVSLKEWELSVVQDGKKEDTSLVIFPDVSVPAEGLLLLTNSDPTADGNLLSGGDDIATSAAEVKGSSHLYLVNAGLSLPDDGQFLLILRKAKEKRGLNEAFVDVAGGGGSGTDAFVREQEGDYDTYVWPLQVLEAPGSATEDALSAGKVWLRAKADIVGYHRDAWAEAAFTGVGYDRMVSKSAETAGTPGYPNGAVKTEAPTPRGAITISEVMFDSAGGTLPQWIELYNASKTDALNLNRWELEIQNVADSEDLVGRPVVRLTLQEKVIQPNQTLLIVTGNARASSADVYPEDRVYNLLELHDKNLRIKKPSDTFLSATGFYLRLTDRNEHLVDEVGNTDGNRRTKDAPAWALPVSGLEGMRSSLIRRYDKGVARDGKEKSSWALAANFSKFKAEKLHYGHADDIGTPGYRQGGALPVELSSFTVTRVESGSVIVTWTTESEVDNAGFNLRRSLTRESGFTLLNPALIAGAGTTGERQTYTYIDTSAKPGVEHYYQIEEVSFGGKAETLVTRRLRGPVSPAHRALKTLGEVKQAK